QKLFTLIAWDKSEAFKGGPQHSIFHNINDVPPELRNRLMTRVLRYPDLYSLYLDTLLECATAADEPDPGSEGGPGWLEREIGGEYAQISAFAASDPVAPFTVDEFNQAVADLVAFARQRGESVRQQVQTARAFAASLSRRR